MNVFLDTKIEMFNEELGYPYLCKIFYDQVRLFELIPTRINVGSTTIIVDTPKLIMQIKEYDTPFSVQHTRRQRNINVLYDAYVKYEEEEARNQAYLKNEVLKEAGDEWRMTGKLHNFHGSGAPLTGI